LGTCSPDDNDDDPPDPADSDADEWDCSGTIKQADDKESCGDTFDVRSGESYTLKVSSLEHDLTRDFEIRVKLIRADKESVVRCDASTLGDGDTCDFKGSSEFQGAVKVSVSGDLANGTGEADPNADFKLKIE
jgi:hypothetical protein